MFILICVTLKERQWNCLSGKIWNCQINRNVFKGKLIATRLPHELGLPRTNQRGMSLRKWRLSILHQKIPSQWKNCIGKNNMTALMIAVEEIEDSEWLMRLKCATRGSLFIFGRWVVLFMILLLWGSWGGRNKVIRSLHSVLFSPRARNERMSPEKNKLRGKKKKPFAVWCHTKLHKVQLTQA